eukprot:6379112-Prymnesium_polylepis.1
MYLVPEAPQSRVGARVSTALRRTIGHPYIHRPTLRTVTRAPKPSLCIPTRSTVVPMVEVYSLWSTNIRTVRYEDTRNGGECHSYGGAIQMAASAS